MASAGDIGWFALVREDLRRHHGEWSAPGFQALAVYRFGRHAHDLDGFAGVVQRKVHRVLFVLVRNFYGIELPAAAVIGRRMYIGHQNGIILNSLSEFGDDCTLSHNVTIGIGSPGKRSVPRFGDRVWIGPGAIVFGRVTVGDDVRIGPNTLVMSDVASGAHVVATPSRTMHLQPRSVDDEPEQAAQVT
jgi:serine O-acetyltransferase